MRFRQKKSKIERVEPEPVTAKDERIAPGASATLSNVGPQRSGVPDDSELDIFEGTSSGMGSSRRGARGKPEHGSREDVRI